MRVTKYYPSGLAAMLLALGCQGPGEPLDSLEDGPEDGPEDREELAPDGPLDFTRPGHSQQGGASMPQLDASFSGNGIVNPSTPGTNVDDTVFAGALQSDGKILLGGSYRSNTMSTRMVSIARLDANGAIDPSFGGGDGFVDQVLPVGTTSAIYGIKVLPDGRIVAAGRHQGKALLLRLLADGSYDPSFATKGWVQSPTLVMDEASHNILALQGDRYLVAGRVNSAPGVRFAVARYLPDGNLDHAFGTAGVALSDFPGTTDYAFTLMVDPYDRIYVAGKANGSFAIARLLTSGALDTSFGTGGIVTTDVPPGNDRIYALALDRKGRLVAAGPGRFSTNLTSNSGWAVARYLPDGSLDPSFDADGMLYDPIPVTLNGVPNNLTNRNDIPFAVTVRTNGDIIVAGQTKYGTPPSRMLLARYKDDGSLDLGFDGDGYYAQSVWDGFTPGYDVAHDLLEQPDGKLVVLGNIGTTSTMQKAALRLQVEPDPWCPDLSDVQTLDGSGATLAAGNVTATITEWAGATTDLRMTVHGSEAFLGIPAPDPDGPTCAGGVIELEPTIGDPLAPAPEVTLVFPCDPELGTYVEHGRSDGTYEYLPAICDEQTEEATLVFQGYGYLRPKGSVPPGCESCPEDGGIAVCDLTSFEPLRGQCYSAQNDAKQAEIGPGGGVLVHPKGATLTIPPGALAQTTTVMLDVAWEKLPKQRIPEDGVPSWRLLAGADNAQLDALATFTFPCGPEGRLRVTQDYDYQQEHVVTCSGGQASLTLDRLGYVQPRGLVETAVVDIQGGILSGDGGAEVAIPAGALATPLDVSIAPVVDGLGPQLDTLGLGSSYALLPHGQVFDAPVEIRLPAPDCVPGRIAVQSRDDEHDASWETIPAECVDGYAVFEDDSFSIKQPVDTVAKSAATCECQCGEDVREMLTATAQQAIVQYIGATDAQRENACGRLIFDGLVPSGTGRINKNGWDINPLAYSEGLKLGAGDEIQNATVTVDGQCYFAGEVNYFLWGVTESLCTLSGDGLFPKLEEEALWKHRFDLDKWGAFGTAPGRVSWTRAGYQAVQSAGLLGGYELNEDWVAPKNHVTRGSGLQKYTGGTCVPSPNDQPYQVGQRPFKWRWGGSGGFSGTVAPIAGPKPRICAKDDKMSATLGQSGVLVAVAPNDDGVYPDLALDVQSQGAFQAIAMHDVEGIPHVELSSQIPTAFAPVETLTYAYQPEEGGVPENLEALIEIDPICPIAEADRPMADYCGCSGGRDWDADTATCECPEGEWNLATQACDPVACGDPDVLVCNGANDGDDMGCLRSKVMVCGSSDRSVSTFFPGGQSFQVVNGCTPDDTVQALLVTRHFNNAINGTTLKAYLEAGGIVITEYNISDEVWSLAFTPTEQYVGSHEGACHDSAPTVVQFTPGDKLWTQLAYQGTPWEQSGCGFSVSGFAGITPLAGWNENAASIGYRDLCRGRVWATDFDWQDNEGYPFAYTAQLMGYFLTHRK